jgi:hypothetical protein
LGGGSALGRRFDGSTVRRFDGSTVRASAVRVSAVRGFDTLTCPTAKESDRRIFDLPIIEARTARPPAAA